MNEKFVKVKIINYTCIFIIILFGAMILTVIEQFELLFTSILNQMWTFPFAGLPSPCGRLSWITPNTNLY